MLDAKIAQDFKAQLPEKQLKLNEPLAPYTTLKIGGPADLFFIAQTEDELVRAVKLAQKHKINLVVLGWGSNILVSDKGFRGLVIRNQSKEIVILDKAPKTKKQKIKPSEPDRHERYDVRGRFYLEFDELNYDESNLPAKLVKVSSGFGLQNLISWSLSNGLTGLQWFARIPGTVGGAVVNNIHGGSHYFEEFLHEVTILDSKGNFKTLKKDKLDLGYDKSYFQKADYTIINCILRLYQGDVNKAKEVSLEWANRKAMQPHNSAGCTFKNITHDDMKRLGYKTTGTGHIVEWIIKWGGKKVGGAIVSKRHHNFIVNDGGATAKDYLTLLKQIKRETKKKTGLNLQPEIFFIGFSNEELKGIV